MHDNKVRLLVTSVVVFSAMLLLCFTITCNKQVESEQPAASIRFIPVGPPLMAVDRGVIRSPEGTRSVRVYTGDPGALGRAMMWIYEVTDDTLYLVSRGRIPTGDDWEIDWLNEVLLEVMYLDEGGYWRPFEVNLSSPPSTGDMSE